MATGDVVLPIADRVVTAVRVSRFEHFLVLEFKGWGVPNSATGPFFSLAINGPFRLVGSGKEHGVDPQAGSDPVYLELVTKTVQMAVASQDGSLAVEFSDGTRLLVAADRYEPWELNGDDHTLFVSVAGGGLSFWRPDEPASN